MVDIYPAFNQELPDPSPPSPPDGYGEVDQYVPSDNNYMNIGGPNSAAWAQIFVNTRQTLTGFGVRSFSITSGMEPFYFGIIGHRPNDPLTMDSYIVIGQVDHLPTQALYWVWVEIPPENFIELEPDQEYFIVIFTPESEYNWYTDLYDNQGQEYNPTYWYRLPGGWSGDYPDRDLPFFTWTTEGQPSGCTNPNYPFNTHFDCGREGLELCYNWDCIEGQGWVRGDYNSSCGFECIASPPPQGGEQQPGPPPQFKRPPVPPPTIKPWMILAGAGVGVGLLYFLTKK